MNLQMKLAASVAVFALPLTGCMQANNAAEKAGVDVEFADVYANADGFVENAWVTIRMFEAAVETSDRLCQKESTPLAFCEYSLETAERLEPAVAGITKSLGTYVTIQGRVDEMTADGETVPVELLATSAAALAKASSEYESIKGDLDRFIGRNF